MVCASDMMALGAIRAARQRGLDVPKDVSVVGFDDSPLIAFTDPPLTTIRKPVPAMGQAAVRTLLEEIGGTPAPHSEFVFMPELVVRGSTASAPGERGRSVGRRPRPAHCAGRTCGLPRRHAGDPTGMIGGEVLFWQTLRLWVKRP